MSRRIDMSGNTNCFEIIQYTLGNFYCAVACLIYLHHPIKLTFFEFLVKNGVDRISLNPDVIGRMRKVVAEVEEERSIVLGHAHLGQLFKVTHALNQVGLTNYPYNLFVFGDHETLHLFLNHPASRVV